MEPFPDILTLHDMTAHQLLGCPVRLVAVYEVKGFLHEMLCVEMKSCKAWIVPAVIVRSDRSWGIT